jgi:hypothetical protein
MNPDSVIQPFAVRASARGKFGIGWAEIIAIVLPIVLECFKTPKQLEDAAAGLTVLQRMGLQLRVRREISRLEQSGRLAFRIGERARAISDTADAIEAELKATAQSDLMQGDIFAVAFEEALVLGGQ